MKVERSIGAPLRSARQTTDDLANFVGEVLRARAFPAAGQVNAQVKRLSPLLNMMLAKRIVATPALRLRTDDMEVRVRIDYEVDATDDLSIPTMTLLGDLDPDTPVDVTLFTTEEIAPGLRALVTATSGNPARLEVVVTGTQDNAAEQVAVAAEDAAEEQRGDEQGAPHEPDAEEIQQGHGGIIAQRTEADPVLTDQQE